MPDATAKPEHNAQRDMRDHVIKCFTRGGEGEHTIVVDDGSFAIIDCEDHAVWLVTIQRAKFEVSGG